MATKSGLGIRQQKSMISLPKKEKILNTFTFEISTSLSRFVSPYFLVNFLLVNQFTSVSPLPVFMLEGTIA